VRPADVDDKRLPDLAGKCLGRYQLLFPIAVGGMAQVWAAKPESGALARKVVIKLVRPEYACDEEYTRMFVDEAMVASSIHHPNVCEIQELGQDEGVLYMVLEWIAGDALSGLISRDGEPAALPLEIAVRIAADACAGLHAAHEAVDDDGQPLNIVHRDVSPPNILLSLHGQVKVSDFGIAKARNQLHSRTRTGEIKGKIAYIPPEQILSKGIDRRADVYALGCVLYLMTLGVRPFGTGGDALAKIVQGKYRLPTQACPEYPPDLEAIVVKAIALEPAQRYQTAEEMRIALEQWLQTREPVTAADLANFVREHLRPNRRQVIESMRAGGQALDLANFLVSQDRTQTPTAKSDLVVQPEWARASLGKLQAAAVAGAQPAPAAQTTPPARPGQPVQPSDIPTWIPPKNEISEIQPLPTRGSRLMDASIRAAVIVFLAGSFIAFVMSIVQR
jgi:eukaryotic-like serine/threonine-protein kinase